MYLLMRGPQLTAYLRQLNKGVYTTNVSAAVRAGFEMTSASLPFGGDDHRAVDTCLQYHPVIETCSRLFNSS